MVPHHFGGTPSLRCSLPQLQPCPAASPTIDRKPCPQSDPSPGCLLGVFPTNSSGQLVIQPFLHRPGPGHQSLSMAFCHHPQGPAHPSYTQVPQGAESAHAPRYSCAPPHRRTQTTNKWLHLKVNEHPGSQPRGQAHSLVEPRGLGQPHKG